MLRWLCGGLHLYNAHNGILLCYWRCVGVVREGGLTSGSNGDAAAAREVAGKFWVTPRSNDIQICREGIRPHIYNK